jgi:hypothetical protein
VDVLTDLELHDWAFARYGSRDLARKLAIVRQLYKDDRSGDALERLLVHGVAKQMAQRS